MSEHIYGYYEFSALPPPPLYSRRSKRRQQQQQSKGSNDIHDATAAGDPNTTSTTNDDPSAFAGPDPEARPPRSRRSLVRGKLTKAPVESSQSTTSLTTSLSTVPTNSSGASSDKAPELASRAAPANGSGAAGAPDAPDSPDPRASSSTAGSSGSAPAPGSASSLNHRPSRPRRTQPLVPSSTAEALSGAHFKYAAMYPDSDPSRQQPAQPASKQLGTAAASSSFPRTESVSSTSVTTALSTRTVISTDPSASGEAQNPLASKPFVQRSGRTYLNDPTLPYLLPVDLAELHRESLRTLLLIQVHGAPVACPALTAKPPMRVLELGCGTGFWSMMCHRYFKSRGHSNIHFTGVDIAPLAPGSANTPADSIKPDKDMNWTFVQHDLRVLPWPFADGEFDLVLNKDMSTALPLADHIPFMEEALRTLKPGGVLEVWETDHTIRMLRPHVPNPSATGAQAEEQDAAGSLGAYMINVNTPLSAPVNTYLVEYNNWVSKAFESRHLVANPCTLVGSQMLMEPDLTGVGSHRVAIPLSEVRWEREGVGGVVTKDGKSYVDTKGKSGDKLMRGAHQKAEKKTLTAGQAALRRTALLTLVEQIQALEPALREVSGKSQDEWDVWMGKMMTELMSDGGTSWGECLESGAWWGRKKQ